MPDIEKIPQQEWSDDRIIKNFIQKARTSTMERSLNKLRELHAQGLVSNKALAKTELILLSSIDGKVG
jgi:hypothetical protein